MSAKIFDGVRFWTLFFVGFRFLKYYAGTAAVRTVFVGEHESAGPGEKRALARAATAGAGSVACLDAFVDFSHYGVSDNILYFILAHTNQLYHGLFLETSNVSEIEQEFCGNDAW